MTTRLLVEGWPGAGKITAAVRLIAILRRRGIAVRGFTTEEIRQGGHRIGFAVTAAGGDRAVLAHVDLAGPPRVGRYGVDLTRLEQVALPALRDAGAGGVVVIDELGKWNWHPAAFRDAVQRLLETDCSLVATVHVRRHPFTDALKHRIEVAQLSVGNRDQLPMAVADRIISRLARD